MVLKKILKEQEELLKDHSEIVSKIESVISEAEELLKTDGKEADDYNSMNEKLSNELMEIGKLVYAKQQENNQANPNGEQPVDPEVVG